VNARQSALAYFPDDYFAARERFAALARTSGANVGAYPLAARGPGSELLSIDTAYFGDPLPRRVLLVSSGIHGVEGFAGSAIQQRFMDELADAPALTKGCGVLLVHALNPYGFAWLRRANENNVDLNRNGLASFPGPSNEAYASLAALLSPHSSKAKANFFTARLLLHALRYGPHTVLQAIAGGQYVFPQGLFYGGNEQQESIRVFAQILDNPPTARARHLLHIDLHTGLGTYGRYKLLPAHVQDPPALRELQAWFGNQAVATSRRRGVRAYEVSGHIGALSARILREVRVYALALEFGTYSLLRVIRCLRYENWLHHHGANNRVLRQRAKTEIMECFCPRAPSWRYRVLEQGVLVLRQACRGFFAASDA
jgi:hypothetical protein